MIVRKRFTPEQFVAYVKGLPKPTWARCVSLHHTYIPDQYSWHGWSSFDGVVRYWQQSLGWSRYVHLFIAIEGGQPFVYVCNPLTERGTGVRGRNSDTIHIEHVWNGDKAPFPPVMLAASHTVQRALSSWAGIPLRRTDPNPPVPARGFFLHRDRRDAYKTCPGKQVTHAALIAKVHESTEDDMTPAQAETMIKLLEKLVEQGRGNSYRVVYGNEAIEAVAKAVGADLTDLRKFEAEAEAGGVRVDA